MEALTNLDVVLSVASTVDVGTKDGVSWIIDAERKHMKFAITRA